MRLPTSYGNYSKWQKHWSIFDPNADLSGFDERFEYIVNYEWEMRFNKKFSHFLKKATLIYPQADMDEAIYSRSPIVGNHENPPWSYSNFRSKLDANYLHIVPMHMPVLSISSTKRNVLN